MGGLAVFNAAILYGFKGEALKLIAQNNPQACPSINSTSVEACFGSVIAVYIPYTAFLGFFVSLFFAALFGRYYESFPGTRPPAKGEIAAVLTAFGLILGDLYGVTLGPLATGLLIVFFAAWTGVYGFALGRLYARYTRTVRFEANDAKLMRVLVDGKDYTGKAMTFAHTSTHEIRADSREGAAFKGWTVSGGVTVEDPKSFETLMDVEGDGLLKAQGSKKS